MWSINTQRETVPATNPLQLNVSFKGRGESKNSSHRWKAEHSKDAVSVILHQHKNHDKSSKFPVSAFGLRSRLFFSPTNQYCFNDLGVWQQEYYQTLWCPKSRPGQPWMLYDDVFWNPRYLLELFFDQRRCLRQPRERKVLAAPQRSRCHLVLPSLPASYFSQQLPRIAPDLSGCVCGSVPGK